MRALIRFLNWRKLRELRRDGPQAQQERFMALVEGLRRSPVALCTREANEQHYEVPAEFYRHVLGPALKYSCGWWEPGVTDLARAEEAMLELYCQRAGLADGQNVLDLGCGWGSFSLFAARRYPGSRFVAVSNSTGQRAYLEEVARREGLANLTVLTRDINGWEPDPQAFDRIVSVEMLEHVRNYERVFGSLRQALRPGGRLFVHVFCHARFAYPFDEGWLERNFFSGGLMPSQQLLLYFSEGLRLEGHWAVDGTHYRRTADAWLHNLRRNRHQVLPLLGGWRRYFEWQLFFLACAELFGAARGSEWLVTHLLWQKCE